MHVPVKLVVIIAGRINRAGLAGSSRNSRVTDCSMNKVIRQLADPCTTPDTHGLAAEEFSD